MDVLLDQAIVEDLLELAVLAPHLLLLSFAFFEGTFDVIPSSQLLLDILLLLERSLFVFQNLGPTPSSLGRWLHHLTAGTILHYKIRIKFQTEIHLLETC